MVGATQQVEQRFLVVFAGAGQGIAPVVELELEVHRAETFAQHVDAGQFVDHAGVQQQVACRPARCAQQAQQSLMHIGPLQQQCQVAFAPQQWLHPVGQSHCRLFGGATLAHPLRGARHQPHQSGAGFLPQRQDPWMIPPMCHPRPKVGRQLRQQLVEFRRAGARLAAAAFALTLGTAAQQLVKFLRHQLAMGVELLQQQVGRGVAQGLGDPAQVVVLRGQHMGLLVVQVLDAVLHLAQKHIGLGQRLGCGLWH